MPDLLPAVDDAQRLVLETLYRVFRETCDWPRYRYVAWVLDERELDLQRVLESMPPGLYWPRNAGGVVWHRDDEILGLRVRGLACCREADSDIACLLAVVHFVVRKWREAKPDSPQSVVEPMVRFADFIGPIESVVGPNPELYRVLLVLELMRVEPFLPSWEGSLEDPRERFIRPSREVLRFRDVETLNDLLEAIPDEWRPSRPNFPPSPGDAPEVGATQPLPAHYDRPEDAVSPQGAETLGRVELQGREGSVDEGAPEGPGPRRLALIAWLLAVAAAVAMGAWFALSPGYTSGGVGITLVGLAVTTAIAVSAWPKTKEASVLGMLVALALAAIGTGATVIALDDSDEPSAEATTTAPEPPPQQAPASLSTTGPQLEIWNKVTNGARLMREDKPAYLSSVPRSRCKAAGCAIPGTDVSTGDAVGPAICQREGPRTTNGDETTTADDKNPGLYTSARWYGVRRPDGTIGYISEVWVRPKHRGGLGLPPCPA